MRGFTALFCCLSAASACALAAQRRRAGATGAAVPGLAEQQRLYLAPFLCATFADWLQGPYIYALYERYGFSERDIGVLFIAGFGSSALFGTFTGSLADRFGRRRACLLYCATYGVSCCTKHSTSFAWLLVGRITGGVATSILFSCFEAWVVADHAARNFPESCLPQTFTLATQGNALAAIFASWLGGWVRDAFDSLVAPFDVAILALLASAVGISAWRENRGEAVAVLPLQRPAATGVGAIPARGEPGRGGAGAAGAIDDHQSGQNQWLQGRGGRGGDAESHARRARGENGSTGGRMALALAVVRRDRKVLLIGLVQSLFEGSMYIFVFMWTPKLEASLGKELPHGQIFGSFMCSMMLGSIAAEAVALPPEMYTAALFLFSSLALTLPALGVGGGYAHVSCFLLFEFCIGMYFPAMSVIKSRHVPEEARATLYNLFRVPLNAIVVAVLANLGRVSDDSVLLVCGFMLALASLLARRLEAALDAERGGA